ncbi:hypothetical protein, partial [Streptomyces pristinaespiralis]|uniref:hypothetical protein n=1 Tax=Streptomyces pristinaespiralis TaxID=38300 RepID=UPI003400797A
VTSQSFPPESAASTQDLREEVRAFLAAYGGGGSGAGGGAGRGGGGGGGEGRWDEGDGPVQIGVYAAFTRLVRHGLEASTTQVHDSIGVALDVLANQPRRPSARAVELLIETTVVAAASRTASGEQPLLAEELESFATSFAAFIDDWWDDPPVSPDQPGGSPSR